jgi:hypothetical protein
MSMAIATLMPRISDRVNSITATVDNRWDEKAGLRRDAVRSPVMTDTAQAMFQKPLRGAACKRLSNKDRRTAGAVFQKEMIVERVLQG